MGQRHAAQPAEPEDRQFAARDPPVSFGEFVARSVRQGDDRAFGHRGIAQRDVERIAVAGDQLHPEREAPLADHPPNPVEPLVIGQAAASLRPAWRPRVAASGGGGEARFVDQPVEQAGSPRELVGQRRGMDQNLAQYAGQRRPALRAGGRDLLRSTIARRYR